MSLQHWALAQLRPLLALEDDQLGKVISYSSKLSSTDAARHLEILLGSSPQALEFIDSFIKRRPQLNESTPGYDEETVASSSGPSVPDQSNDSSGGQASTASVKSSSKAILGASGHGCQEQGEGSRALPPPAYSQIDGDPTDPNASTHSNKVIEAGKLRAKDEQEMQQLLQNLQFKYGIYHSDIEPEHDIDSPCNCPIHEYQLKKFNRLDVQKLWSKAVMYPGEKSYSDSPMRPIIFNSNPYTLRALSPYGNRLFMANSIQQRLEPSAHAAWLRDTIALNKRLNEEAEAKVNAQEPKQSIWRDDMSSSLADTTIAGSMTSTDHGAARDERRQSFLRIGSKSKERSNSRFSSFRRVMGIKSGDEKETQKASTLREEILAEERGRWPNEHWKQIVISYQHKVGMAKKIDELRARYPIQYLNLLRAGYFEPVPTAWANQAANPLTFTIDAISGWRGITPSWRGYEDLAEERLYWVLNHREGTVNARMKPDIISALKMAQDRMARAVEPPPLYESSDDTCRLGKKSAEYSKQVMPTPFAPHDRPELPTDETVILLDVSGSMDFDPVRPLYSQYLITCFINSTQPKNKDVAKSLIRRFTDAMAQHDHQSAGYDLVTFANQAQYMGKIGGGNMDRVWQNIRFGGGTRVMTGWQKVKERHFQKHSAMAIRHPVYGWQAGPEFPILRLLLLLDGEARDMDEFELDLLGQSWAHVTIFLIGVDGCPHHHRHANELQRISDVNNHVSFVDAQGNFPERFVTHELLKRHLGYDITMREFERMEEPPSYHNALSGLLGST